MIESRGESKEFWILEVSELPLRLTSDDHMGSEPVRLAEDCPAFRRFGLLTLNAKYVQVIFLVRHRSQPSLRPLHLSCDREHGGLARCYQCFAVQASSCLFVTTGVARGTLLARLLVVLVWWVRVALYAHRALVLRTNPQRGKHEEPRIIHQACKQGGRLLKSLKIQDRKTELADVTDCKEKGRERIETETINQVGRNHTLTTGSTR